MILGGEVPNKVWTGKHVSYDHLRVFGCKCSVHIPKDERSKLDMKSHYCIFLGYGQDEFGYRLYNPVAKKLVRSRDVIFFEDETIEDINKAKDNNLKGKDVLIDSDPVQLSSSTENEVQQDNAQDNNQDEHDVHLENVSSEQEELPSIPIRRSTRDHQPSRRYSQNEYVLVKDEGEPESYEEAMDSDSKQQWFDAIKDEMNLYMSIIHLSW